MPVTIDHHLLKGKYISLEKLAPEHKETLRLLAKDPRIWEYTRTLLINDTYDRQFDSYFTNALDEQFGGLQYSFIMRDARNGNYMGSTRYYKLDAFHKRLSIGYTFYHPDYWGRVHNKECKLLLLQYAFETLGYQRVELEVAHQNERSQKAVLKIGATLEGRLRKHGRHADGTIRDTLVYSITDDEWPVKKELLQKLVATGKP